MLCSSTHMIYIIYSQSKTGSWKVGVWCLEGGSGSCSMGILFQFCEIKNIGWTQDLHARGPLDDSWHYMIWKHELGTVLSHAGSDTKPKIRHDFTTYTFLKTIKCMIGILFYFSVYRTRYGYYGKERWDREILKHFILKACSANTPFFIQHTCHWTSRKELLIRNFITDKIVLNLWPAV